MPFPSCVVHSFNKDSPIVINQLYGYELFFKYQKQFLLYMKSNASNNDNFSFQNNGIKKCTCWKTMGFLWKTMVFFFKKAMVLTRLYTWFISIIMHNYAFYPNKNYSCLNKISFHNTIPHRSHSLIGYVIQELW